MHTALAVYSWCFKDYFCPPQIAREELAASLPQPSSSSLPQPVLQPLPENPPPPSLPSQQSTLYQPLPQFGASPPVLPTAPPSAPPPASLASTSSFPSASAPTGSFPNAQVSGTTDFRTASQITNDFLATNICNQPLWLQKTFNAHAQHDQPQKVFSSNSHHVCVSGSGHYEDLSDYVHES